MFHFFKTERIHVFMLLGQKLKCGPRNLVRYHGTPLPSTSLANSHLASEGDLVPQGTLHKIWKHFWLPVLAKQWFGSIISKRVKIRNKTVIEVVQGCWAPDLFPQECRCTVWGKSTPPSIWTFTTWKMAQWCWTLFTRKNCFFFLWDLHWRCDLMDVISFVVKLFPVQNAQLFLSRVHSVQVTCCSGTCYLGFCGWKCISAHFSPSFCRQEFGQLCPGSPEVTVSWQGAAVT